MKVVQNPAYKPIIQLPSCCVPACLSMIFDRRGITHGSQEDIGIELGLVVSSKNAHLFKKATVDDSYTGRFGTQIDDKKYSINNFFYDNNYQLQEKYFPAEKVQTPKEFIEENLREGNDLIACLKNTILGGSGKGHAVLIQEIKDNEVTIVDPWKDNLRIAKVELNALIEAMKANKNRGGFWVISDKKRNKPSVALEIFDRVIKSISTFFLLAIILGYAVDPKWSKLHSGYDEWVHHIYVVAIFFIALNLGYALILYVIHCVKNIKQSNNNLGVKNEKNSNARN